MALSPSAVGPTVASVAPVGVGAGWVGNGRAAPGAAPIGSSWSIPIGDGGSELAPHRLSLRRLGGRLTRRSVGKSILGSGSTIQPQTPGRSNRRFRGRAPRRCIPGGSHLHGAQAQVGPRWPGVHRPLSHLACHSRSRSTRRVPSRRVSLPIGHTRRWLVWRQRSLHRAWSVHNRCRSGVVSWS
jgi:hypothetical protein